VHRAGHFLASLTTTVCSKKTEYNSKLLNATKNASDRAVCNANQEVLRPRVTLVVTLGGGVVILVVKIVVTLICSARE
jgi:hypothetical protein